MRGGHLQPWGLQVRAKRPLSNRRIACDVRHAVTPCKNWGSESPSPSASPALSVNHGPRKVRRFLSGSSGRTRTCNLVVTRAPEFLPGLDYLFTLPEGSGMGCRALPPGDAWSTSRSSSLCTFPEHRRPRAWLRVTVLRFRRRAGFPEFTRFFNHDSSWKLQLGVNPVIATFTHKFTFLQPPALPIELPRSVPRYCSKSRGKYQ